MRQIALPSPRGSWRSWRANATRTGRHGRWRPLVAAKPTTAARSPRPMASRLACDAVGIGTRYFLRVSTQLRGHTYVHADILAYIKPKNRATIVDALVALVASGAAGGQERAAAALAVLACDVPNQTAIAAAGGVVALVALVTHGTAAGREAAARALGALAQAAANRSAIADA